MRQVHSYWNVVICQVRGSARVVTQPLLLLLLWPLLILLGASPPCSWSELVLVLSKRIVEPPWVWDSSSGPDEFDHLSPFSDVDCLCLVFVVILREWVSDDLF
jgi:hypothetical protein